MSNKPPTTELPVVSIEPVFVPLEQVRAAMLTVPAVETIMPGAVGTPATVDDLMDPEGTGVIGARLTLAVSPSITVVYCGAHTDGEAIAYLFPGDDALLSGVMINEISKVMSRAGVNLTIMGAFAPMFADGSVSFSTEEKDILQQTRLKYEGALRFLTQKDLDKESAKDETVAG